MALVLEFWPEYNSGPLWTTDGTSVDLAMLALSDELRTEILEWNSRYHDSRLPLNESEEAWLAEGRLLLHKIRASLGDAYDVVVTEPWWGESPSA